MNTKELNVLYDNSLDQSLKKIIIWFDKNSGEFLGAEEIIDVSITILKKIFDVNEFIDPYMMDAYNVCYDHIKYIQPYLSHNIDLNKYDYSIHINNS